MAMPNLAGGASGVFAELRSGGSGGVRDGGNGMSGKKVSPTSNPSPGTSKYDKSDE